ncbi:hypothetical protein DUNSADRAFT_8959 [Dunaliella salina]|uniref:Uncharacterized protein n=1 Tax=Dunaliella salina TaxID=3046 RepID=A0ABQ7GIJ7_DUNSA|nr:hypothetical protein DUNSADRAFT_8959 [Dunaliella salina]|eukprot:KAF5834404.1 hypothetical protein DUNSADRAFT_8959 [Dunaliella salina]
MLSGLREAFVPTSQAVRHQHPQPAGGAAGAGTPTGEDHTQRTPGTVFGDDVAQRDPKTFERHVTGPPTAAGTAPTKHAPVLKSHMATAGDEPTSRTPERMFYEELQAKIRGSPEAAGIPRRGVDELGGYVETLRMQAKERAQQNVSWLYPFSKDAGDPRPAEQAAKSYNDYRADKAREAEELAVREAEQEEKRSAAKQAEGKQQEPEEKQEETGPVQEHEQEGLLRRLGHMFVGKKHEEGGAPPTEEHAVEAGTHREAEEAKEERGAREEHKAPASGVVEEGAAGPMGKGGVITQVLRWSKGVGLESHKPESSSRAAPEKEAQTSELGQQEAGGTGIKQQERPSHPSAAPEDVETAEPAGPEEVQAVKSAASKDKTDDVPASPEGGQAQPIDASKDRETKGPTGPEGGRASRGGFGAYSFSQEIDNVEAGSTFSA